MPEVCRASRCRLVESFECDESFTYGTRVSVQIRKRKKRYRPEVKWDLSIRDRNVCFVSVPAHIRLTIS